MKCNNQTRETFLIHADCPITKDLLNILAPKCSLEFLTKSEMKFTLPCYDSFNYCPIHDFMY